MDGLIKWASSELLCPTVLRRGFGNVNVGISKSGLAFWRQPMAEIQQQVEQFMKDHWVFDDDYKGTALYHDTHNLLRRVVEE